MSKASGMAVLALAMAMGTSSAADAQPLPLRHGFYAQVGKGCATGGSFQRYSRLLTYDGESLDDTAHERRFLGVDRAGRSFEALLSSRDLSTGSERRLDWYLVVGGPGRFVLTGADGATNWTGDYQYCGPNLP